jgi:hypothetical protein
VLLGLGRAQLTVGGGCLLGAVGGEVVVARAVGRRAAAAGVQEWGLVKAVMLVWRLAGAVGGRSLVAEGLALAETGLFVVAEAAARRIRERELGEHFLGLV